LTENLFQFSFLFWLVIGLGGRRRRRQKRSTDLELSRPDNKCGIKRFLRVSATPTETNEKNNEHQKIMMTLNKGIGIDLTLHKLVQYDTEQ